MRLEEDKIVIESRYEIDDIIDMINSYQKSGMKKQRLTDEKLEVLKGQLNALYTWW